MVAPYAAHAQGQPLAWKEWLDDRMAKWDEGSNHNVVWWTGIGDIAAEVLPNAREREAAGSQEERNKRRDEIARQDRRFQEASQHAGVTQIGEPEMLQLQQQPKPNPKLQLTLQPEC